MVCTGGLQTGFASEKSIHLTMFIAQEKVNTSKFLKSFLKNVLFCRGDIYSVCFGKAEIIL